MEMLDANSQSNLENWKAHTSWFQNLPQSYSQEDGVAWCAGRRTHQQNEVGSLDTNPCIYNWLAFHGRASPSFPNCPGTTAGGPHAEQWSHPPQLVRRHLHCIRATCAWGWNRGKSTRVRISVTFDVVMASIWHNHFIYFGCAGPFLSTESLCSGFLSLQRAGGCCLAVPRGLLTLGASRVELRL